ncbi:MAG: SDR family NAD(P)-dependent oxidoreductase [Actinomycetota bacterium]
MPLGDPTGKVAVVTGAGSGIGRALVDHARSLDMRVAAVDVAGDALSGFDPDVVTHVVDIADPSAVDDLADRVFDRWGAVHLLCNNAGVFQAGRAWEATDAEWRWAFDVNVFGILNGIRSFVPRMLDGGDVGHVVNTASVAGFVAAPMNGPYTASKVAALSVTECLAHDLQSVGARIGASVLTPSAIRTGIARTDAVRPADLDHESELAAGVRDILESLTDAGLEPAEVPPIVFAAIDAGDFLIPTKPSHRDQIEIRFEAMRERRLPPTPPVD